MQTGVTLDYACVPYCFGDTYWCLKKGKIGQTEYVKRVVAHLGGIRHIDPSPLPSDDSGICPRFTPDRFGIAIRRIAIEQTYRPIRDLKSYEKLFNDCLENKYDDAIKNLTILRMKKPNVDPIQPVAALAAQHGHTKILKYCLAHGAVLDRNLGRAMTEGTTEDPSMEAFVDEQMDFLEVLLETQHDENGRLAASEYEEFDVIDW